MKQLMMILGIVGLMLFGTIAAQADSYSVHHDFETGWSEDYASGWTSTAYRHGVAPIATMSQVALGDDYGRIGYGAKITVQEADWHWWANIHVTGLPGGVLAKDYNPWLSVDLYDAGSSAGRDATGQLYNVPPHVVEGDWTDVQFGGRTADAVASTYFYTWADAPHPGWKDSRVSRPSADEPDWVNLKMQLSSADGKIRYYINDALVGSTTRDNYLGLGAPMFSIMFDTNLADWDDNPYVVIDNFRFGSDAQAAGRALIESGGHTVGITSHPDGSSGKGTGGMSTAAGTAVALAETVALNNDDIQTAMTALGTNYLTLKMYYDPNEVAELGIIESTLRPYWWDDVNGQWILGGTTPDGQVGESLFAGIDVDESLYGLGYCGLNMVENYTWVNLNHASEYGMAGNTPPVSEPASLGLLGLALLGLRKRRS
jgi:hypothetical protein